MMNQQVAATDGGASVCSSCNTNDRRIFHRIYLNKVIHLLCTTCVLKNNLKSFCPVCFSLHHRPGHSPSPATPSSLQGTIVCFKCKSVSHATCVSPNAPKSPHFCPFCLNPNSFKLLELYKSSKSIDLKSSMALRAATMISMNSLEEASDQARVKAETLAKAAVDARMKAKDALDRVAILWSEKMERMRLNTEDNGDMDV